MNFNISSYFLPQLVGLHKFDEGFINCYIMDVEDDQPFEHIYVVMESESSMLDIHPYTVSKRTVDEGNLYKISVHKRFHEDLKLFYQGKYSQMSSAAKQVIVDGDPVNPDLSLGYNVLYKTPKRRKYIEDLIGQELPEDAEVMSRLNIKKEVYG